jgi:hypothetical protein
VSNIELYQPLLELSAALNEHKKELKEKPSWKRKSELKKAIQNIEQELANKSSELIGSTVNSWNLEQSLSSFLEEELDAVKEMADKSWHCAIKDIKTRLIKLAEKEGKKSPIRRKIEKNGWWLAIAAIGLVMVTLKWYWLVDVNKPMELTAGVAQRAKALEKLIDYDDSMDARVRRGAWLKDIFLWPAKPTDKEAEYASEFLWTSLDIYDYLKAENVLCGANLLYDANDESFDDEIEIAQIAINYANNTDNVNTAESGPLLLMSAFTSKFPCQ